MARLVVKLSGQHALPSALVMTAEPDLDGIAQQAAARLDHKSLPVVSNVNG